MHYTTLAQLLTTQIGWAWNAFPYSQLNLAVCGRGKEQKILVSLTEHVNGRSQENLSKLKLMSDMYRK